MIKFATPTKPTALPNRMLQVVSYGLGLWTTVLAAAQMVSFEKFVTALSQYHLAGDGWTVAIAIGVLALEVFSVPFLFRLPLSRAARFVSALYALLLPYAWMAMTLMALARGVAVSNSGIFGGFLQQPVSMLMLVSDAAWIIVMSLSFSRLGGMKALQALEKS
jgi:hypothetical protein